MKSFRLFLTSLKAHCPPNYFLSWNFETALPKQDWFPASEVREQNPFSFSTCIPSSSDPYLIQRIFTVLSNLRRFGGLRLVCGCFGETMQLRNFFVFSTRWLRWRLLSRLSLLNGNISLVILLFITMLGPENRRLFFSFFSPSNRLILPFIFLHRNLI